MHQRDLTLRENVELIECIIAFAGCLALIALVCMGIAALVANMRGH